MTVADVREATAKALTGAAIGHAGGPFPTELALALGLRPVSLLDLGGASDSAIEAEWIDDKEDPDIRSVFVRAMRGDFAQFAGLVSTRATDHVHYYLREALRLGAWAEPVPLHIFDLIPLRGEGVAAYNRGSVQRLTAFLERVSGRKLTAEALRAAVDQTNVRRAALRDLAALRAARRVAGVEAFNAMLEGRAPAPSAVAAPRLLLLASAPLSGVALHQAVEGAGWTVAAEDDGTSRFVPVPDLDFDGDLLGGLADHYTALPTGLSHPREDRTVLVERCVREGAIEAVLFWMHPGDMRLGWDFPPLRDRLADAGIPAAMVRADISGAEGLSAVGAAATALRQRLRP